MQCDVCKLHHIACNVCNFTFGCCLYMLAEKILLRVNSEMGVVHGQAQIRIAGGASLADLGVAKQVCDREAVRMLC